MLAQKDSELQDSRSIFLSSMRLSLRCLAAATRKGPGAVAAATPQAPCVPKKLAATAVRSFSLLPSDMPNSWTEPEALSQWHLNEEYDDVDEAISELGERNEIWRKQIIREDPEIFDRIGAGQAPKFLWIGCCDSRVAPETLINAKPGELFVHRNIANMVVSTDTNLRSVMQYAIDYLQVEHVIVCGHYECGGVKAAASIKDHASPLESWLANIRDVIRLHKDELDAIEDEDDKHKRMVDLNVTEQCLNLYKSGVVQRRRAYTAQRLYKFAAPFPRIHGMVFSPKDGILRKLQIDFKAYFDKYEDIYNLYDTDQYLASTV